MALGAYVCFACKHTMHAIKHSFADDRLVDADETLVCLLDLDKADVKGIVQQSGQSIARDWTAMMITQTKLVKLRAQSFKAITPTAI
jgi:hypothetical protein